MPAIFFDILAASSDYEAGQRAGRVIGLFFWPAIILFVVYRASRRLQDPRMNRKAVHSCIILLLSWLAFGIVQNVIGEEQEKYRSVLTPASYLVISATALSAIFAIQGLVETRKDPEAYTGGRGYAIATLIISVIVGGVMGVAGYDALQRQLSVKKPDGESAKPDAKPTVFEFSDRKFNYHADHAWVKFDAKAVSPDAVHAMMRMNPNVLFVVVAEVTGDLPGLDSEALADLAVENLKSSTTNTAVITREPAIVAGIAGVSLFVHGDMGPQRFSYLTWTGFHDGVAYEIRAWTRRAEEQGMKNYIQKIRDGFRLRPKEASKAEEKTGKDPLPGLER